MKKKTIGVIVLVALAGCALTIQALGTSIMDDSHQTFVKAKDKCHNTTVVVLCTGITNTEMTTMNTVQILTVMATGVAMTSINMN